MTLANATILVVDDELELLEIFSAWLRRSGCNIVTAVNGVDALTIINERQIDALISDIRMPIMDGVTLVRKLVELHLHIPSIIFISGFGDIDAREVHALGVEAMIAKPLSRQQLLDALERSLKERNELWTELQPQAAPQSVNVRFPSLTQALAASEFAIGRGGCAFQYDKPLTIDEPVDMSIHFDQERSDLNARAIVRWTNQKEGRVGAEFVYLDPASRPWVMASMNGHTHSYIPR